MTRGDLIGEIVTIQVQRVPLKQKGVGYSPKALLPVSTAMVDAWGMTGWDGEQWVIDAHHKAHPSRRGGGRRPLSIGFTGHYTRMEERFGSAPVGVAGENIIVDGPELWLDDLGDAVIVETVDGEDLLLERPRVAAPCLEFTSFLLGLDHVGTLDDIGDSLHALDDGRRGFIVAADHSPNPVELRVGAPMYHAVP